MQAGHLGGSATKFVLTWLLVAIILCLPYRQMTGERSEQINRMDA